MLAARQVTVVPDILANAGGVTASYFEWAQSRQGYAWDETFTVEMVEDEFQLHERKLGQTLPVTERKRLLELWHVLHDERNQRAA